MATLLVKTKAVLEDCEKHLHDNKAFGSEIESYLTQYLLIVLCADIQQEIYKITDSRALAAGDVAISTYISAASKRILRSVSKEEIGKYVGMFGDKPKSRMNSLISDSDVTVYGNAINNRHEVAHKSGTQVTFGELKDAVKAADNILFAVAESLGISEP
ncbi:MAG: hypothetical protein QM739_18120 [Propionivibrio sp.]